jgi:hypothetical protein
MGPEIDHVPNYYIESVTRGSLTIVCALSAAAYFLLQKTLGKTVEVAWEKTVTHKRLVQFLSNSTPEKAVKPRRRATRIKNLGEKGERWQWLQREFSAQFLNRPGFGRFEVKGLTISEMSNRDMLVQIYFDLPEQLSEREASFKELRYSDFIHQYGQKPPAKTVKRRRRQGN